MVAQNEIGDSDPLYSMDSWLANKDHSEYRTWDLCVVSGIPDGEEDIGSSITPPEIPESL